MFEWLASNPAGVSFSMVVINGFAVTATVIVTGGPVYVAPDDAAGALAGAGALAVPGALAAAGVLAVPGDAAAPDVVGVLAPLGALALGLLDEHALTMTETADTTATADAARLRRLLGPTCTVPPHCVLTPVVRTESVAESSSAHLSTCDTLLSDTS